MTTPESVVEQAYQQYQEDIVGRALGILTSKGLTESDWDVVVDVMPVQVAPRTEAAITGLLHNNRIYDIDERATKVIEETYRIGLSFHALITALGQVGIRLAVTDEGKRTQFLKVGTMGEVRNRDEQDHSMLSLLAEIVQDDLEDDTAVIEELAGAAGDTTGAHAMQVQHVGMQALHMAILEHEQDLTHMPGGDLMNRGAQLFCIFASLQLVGARFSFIDEQGYVLPVRDDLNKYVKTIYGGESAEE